ncbi:MAG: T9SS type A sorting domain-containing protein, partial [Sphingobacteriales bacterium]
GRRRGLNRGPDDAVAIISTMLYPATGPLKDGNRVVFDDAFSDIIDRNDAIKTANAGINFGLLRRNTSLAVETKSALKATDTLFYTMTGVPVGDFRIGIAVENIQPNGLTAELVDKFTNLRTSVSLTDSSFIHFSTTSAVASRAADRFMLVFRKSLVVLPVNFVSISARRQADRNIAIDWKVANEINIVRYEVERSANGVNFTGILTKDAAGTLSYAQTDLSPLAADNFYRIKAIGLGNDVTYSSIVKVAPLPGKASIAVYPNPVTGNTINLVFTTQPKGSYALQLINVEGQLIYKGSVNVTGENFNHSIKLGEMAAGGTYQLTIRAEDGSSKTIKVMSE